MELATRKIILGVSGGIAAYKSAELVRLLVGEGAAVQVVMSEAAKRFVTPVTFQALSGRHVFTDQWDARVANNMAHIDLSRGADALLVAPASADFLAKLAHGLADDLLTTLVLARDCPLLVAPAMNRQMWDNPATQRNVALLRSDGIQIVGPASGSQACGENGPGRMLEPGDILAEVIAHFQAKVLRDRRVLLTAGPTFEAIDPVRGITNLSSGRMGYAIARAASEAGARVTLVSGPVHLSCPLGVRRIAVSSALEMHAAVHREVADNDVFVAVAAVADYRPAMPFAQKIKKGAQAAAPTIELVQNPDILGEVAALAEPPLCVGFAAESEKLHEYAERKRRSKRIPLIVGNLIGDGFGGDDNTLILFDDEGQHPLPTAPKIVLARQLVARIATLLEKNSWQEEARSV